MTHNIPEEAPFSLAGFILENGNFHFRDCDALLASAPAIQTQQGDHEQRIDVTQDTFSSHFG